VAKLKPKEIKNPYVHESISQIVDEMFNNQDIILQEQSPPNLPIIKAGSLKKLIERLTFYLYGFYLFIFLIFISL